jgi:hypothetical protein
MMQGTEDPTAPADGDDAAAAVDAEPEVVQSPYRLVASPLLVGGPAPGGGLTGGPGIGTTWLALGGPLLGESPDVADGRIASAVQSALEDEPMLDAETIRGIDVLVHGSAVTLQGDVPASSDREAAGRAVERLPGVSAFDNRLRVAGDV